MRLLDGGSDKDPRHPTLGALSGIALQGGVQRTNEAGHLRLHKLGMALESPLQCRIGWFRGIQCRQERGEIVLGECHGPMLAQPTAHVQRRLYQKSDQHRSDRSIAGYACQQNAAANSPPGQKNGSIVKPGLHGPRQSRCAHTQTMPGRLTDQKRPRNSCTDQTCRARLHGLHKIPE